jgi:hypothetical protein
VEITSEVIENKSDVFFVEIIGVFLMVIAGWSDWQEIRKRCRVEKQDMSIK